MNVSSGFEVNHQSVNLIMNVFLTQELMSYMHLLFSEHAVQKIHTYIHKS
jgi:hypothetical protein